MKIQGLNRDDLDWIDKACRFFMSAQANQIKGAINCGSPELIRDNIDGLEESLKTYDKVVNEMRKYEENKNG